MHGTSDGMQALCHVPNMSHSVCSFHVPFSCNTLYNIPCTKEIDFKYHAMALIFFSVYCFMFSGCLLLHRRLHLNSPCFLIILYWMLKFQCIIVFLEKILDKVIDCLISYLSNKCRLVGMNQLLGTDNQEFHCGRSSL